MNKIIVILSFLAVLLCGVDQSEAAPFSVLPEVEEQALNGNAEAQYNLGKLYYDHTVHKNYYKKAEFWLRKASDQKHVLATGLLAVLMQRQKQHEEAVRLYTSVKNILQKEAAAGKSRYQVVMGLVYGYGAGEKKDIKIAYTWYKKAAEQGDADGQYFLACRYDNGSGVEKNLKTAFYWFMKSAEQNHFRAQNSVGFAYARGDGVKKDYKNAVNWYYKAAVQGYSWGEYNLGLQFKNGRGVPQDLKRQFYGMRNRQNRAICGL